MHTHPPLQVTDPEQIKAGRITLELRRSVAAGLRTTPPSAGAVGGGAALGHLPEGKKVGGGGAAQRWPGMGDVIGPNLAAAARRWP
jgi:hypothetical protein